MTKRRLVVVGAALVLAACCLGAWAAESPTSGLQAGEGTPAFNVQDVTGLAKGGTICYI
jgi:Spy/CpxP family protein refolding chaperone